MQSINTVNFIVIKNDTERGQIQEVISFPDTVEGNKEVESIFIDRIRETAHFEADIPSYVEDGFYCCPDGMEFSIVHSTD